MPTYYMNEGAFELEGFHDRTVHALDTTLPDGRRIALVVSRLELPAGKALREGVDDHVRKQGARLSGYTLLDRRDTDGWGAPAIEIRARWRHEGKLVYERQTHLVLFDKWMFFGLTGPFDEREACEEHMERIRTSLRLRE
jgi:hypothetical protein